MEIELNPIDFITIGTVGPKGRRQFNLQAGQDTQLVTLTLEKQQARQLAEAINEILEDLDRQGKGSAAKKAASSTEMDLRDPIEPQFRIGQMGLGYDEAQDMIILVAQELMISDEETELTEASPSVARFWGTREQYRALSEKAMSVVEQGRADPRHNGHVIYYWT
ncbi:MAG: DUF3090 family protein [Chloroflexi bacterium]|nr:DUF3090 family protein [Chloroflexota bacterium]